MTTQLAPVAVQRFFDNLGLPAIGGQVYTYAAGTTTPLATYTDSTGTTANTNPIILNTRGEAAIWLTQGLAYKFVVKDVLGNILETADNITSDGGLLALVQGFANSSGSSLVGFIQAGTGAVARTVQAELRETVKVTQFGAVAGTADSTAALQLAINAIGVGTKLIFPPGIWNFTNLTFTSKTDFQIEVQGQLVNIATKPGAATTDLRSTAGGLQTIKFDTCSRFKITGAGSIQNGYREPLYFTTCTDFDVSLDCRGNGTNDNLTGIYLRYCQRFHFGRMTVDGVTLKPTNNSTEVFGNWTNNVQIWDCSAFVFDSGFTSRNSGMNGIYPASNCSDFTITDCIFEYNAGSGIQLAWSSFGVFPSRFNISNNIIRYNQADGIDCNNTIGTGQDIHATFNGNVLVYNGWINCNPANAAGADGSGIGTFYQVNRWSATGNVVFECASHGAFVSNCNNWKISDSPIIKLNAGTQNGGIYITGGTSGSVTGCDVRTLSTSSALTTQSMNDVIIRDNSFDGQLSFQNGSYAGCKFSENKCTAYTQVLVQFDMMDNDFVIGNATQNGLYVANPGCKIQRNKVSATGQGIVNTSVNYTDISGNTVTASGGEGITVIASTGVRVEGNNSSTSANAAGIRLSGACVSCSLAMNQAASTGGGNSLLVDAAATLTQKWGNIGLGGATSYGGTYGINF